MIRQVKIGIIGCGHIASKVGKTLVALRKQNLILVGVASRNIEKAKALRDALQIEKYYGSYDELINDPEIEAIYVATTHNDHYQTVKKCLEHNKHVICEKAFTLNQAQAENLFNIAKERNLLLTEALWTRYMPFRKKLEEILSKRLIGDMKIIHADFGMMIKGNPRINSRELGGGGLLDLGIYCVSMADLISRTPLLYTDASCTYLDTEVDNSMKIQMVYADGCTALLRCSISEWYGNDVLIVGEKGTIHIDSINHPTKIVVYNENKNILESETFHNEISGYEYEFIEFMNTIKENGQECPSMPHKDTLRLLSITDHIRSILNLTYPDEGL